MNAIFISNAFEDVCLLVRNIYVTNSYTICFQNVVVSHSLLFHYSSFFR